VQRSGGIGQVWRAFAVEEGHQYETFGTGGRRQREPVEFVEVHPEHGRDGGQHRSTVERADQG